ncbi:MAG: ATP-binding cassette domain-containing protein, partial [Eggerthella lenta]
AYKRGHEVLRDVGLEAHSGEVIALVGANGAGKTTLASILSGLRRPSKGIIRLTGRRRSARALRKASYFVMQDADY